MELPLTTPALLFPAISLLMLAYTNRFVTLANVIRNLHQEHQDSPSPIALAQIRNLRKRIHMIRMMQELGVSSFLCCIVCMAAIFYGWATFSKLTFALSLVLFGASLVISIVEIHISVKALDISLSVLEEDCERD